MNEAREIREEFMNGSRTILPRVGGGVRGRVGLGFGVIQDQVDNLTVGAPRSPQFGFGVDR